MHTTVALLRESEALLEGHFILSSGRHSDCYFQCARLLMFPDRAEAALAGLAGRLAAERAEGRLKIDCVAGPALGGILPAWILGKALGLLAMFTERDDAGQMCLRRGFAFEPGARILVVEDVITTGKSSGEAARAIEASSGRVVALACIVDRRSLGAPSLEWPLFAAATLPAVNWEAAECPLCAKGLPAVKPGSRKMPG
jgi:orotate phosphoribosyltransferase